MLTGKKQRKYLAKKGREWQDQLRSFDALRGDEALHLLRLAVKKIKAFARLSEACSGKAAVKDFRLLQKMFRQAGAVRDLGNRLELLEHFHEAPPGYRLQQEQQKQIETTVFVDHIVEYRKRGRKAGRRLSHDVHGIHSGCVRKWYAGELVHISVLLTASGDRLHKARKKIKELLYVLKLLPSKLQDGLSLDTAYLDRL
ncbi:MAG TPA: CHAD domain-containing protein, partial [Puia sp.]|nr:CHAD domain-containing protein [Puia sp.]